MSLKDNLTNSATRALSKTNQKVFLVPSTCKMYTQEEVTGGTTLEEGFAFSPLLDIPVVSCSWGSGDSLVVSRLEFPPVPCLDKASKQFPCSFGFEIIKVSALLFFQPCRKLLILREVVLT